MICSDNIVIEMFLHVEMRSKPKMTIFQYEDRLINYHIKSDEEHSVLDLKQLAWLSCATDNGFNCC